MDGVIGLIALVGLLFFNYYLVGNLTHGLTNQKLRALTMSVANFVLVLLFIVCLPMVGGYSYDGIQDIIDVFDGETATLLSIAILGFLIAKISK